MKATVFLVLILLSKTAYAWHFWDMKGSVALVFHESFCESLSDSLDSYVASVEQRGHTVIRLCSLTHDVQTLKENIKTAAAENNVLWKEVRGINLFGPVLHTRVHRGLLQQQDQVVFASQVLAYDDLQFDFRSDYVINIRGAYFMPTVARWVSHQFSAGEQSLEAVGSAFSVMSQTLAFRDEENLGQDSLRRAREHLNEARHSVLDDWYRSNGVGGGAVGMALVPSFMWLAAKGREWEGYSPTDRYQTTGDMIGTPILNLAYLSLFCASAYVMANRLLLTYALPELDIRWKKSIFRERLNQDGLARKGR